ncbi:MAG: sodium:glutamate symporter [Planctomycetes bacterium]|nr:sodium:glutamate symporter [Planctomycetota bacterium]
MAIVMPFLGLCLMLFVGHFLRSHIRILRKLYLPSSIIAGLMALIIIQISGHYGGTWHEDWIAGWGKLPGFLINIVFACLFLGVTIPKISTLWHRAGPQLAYGQVVAWGQYVVGIGLVMVLLGPLFGVNPMFGGIIPVGFEGGHGTAGGLETQFVKLGWTEGKDIALASATAGLLSAVIVGMILINWAARKGYTVRRREPDDIAEDDSIAVIPLDRRPEAGKLTVRSDAVEAFSLHIAIVGLAVFIGFVIQMGLRTVGGPGNTANPSVFSQVMNSFPLFPLCMLGGIVVQLLADRFDKYRIIDPGLTRRIQNSALDFLVIAAIATIRIEAVRSAIWPFLIIVAAGILWNVFCVVVLARRMLPDAWFERSIAEMGQSMGVTATGLLLLRVVDPDYESPAADAFASKQLMHEPFMGGGLWTSTAIPLLAAAGSGPVFAIAIGAVVVWLAIVFIPKALRDR